MTTHDDVAAKLRALQRETERELLPRNIERVRGLLTFRMMICSDDADPMAVSLREALFCMEYRLQWLTMDARLNGAYEDGRAAINASDVREHAYSTFDVSRLPFAPLPVTWYNIGKTQPTLYPTASTQRLFRCDTCDILLCLGDVTTAFCPRCVGQMNSLAPLPDGGI